MKRILATLLALLQAFPLWAATPVCTSAGTAAGSMVSSAVLTIPNVTIGASNGYLAVLFGYRSRTITVTSVERNGQALTSIGSLADADDAISAHMYRYVNPSVGTFDVVVTLSGTFVGSAAGGALSCLNVHQGTSEGTAASNQGSGSVTATVTSASGELVISVAAKNDGSVQPPTLSVVGGATELFNVTSTDGTGSDVVVGASYKAGAASVDMDWTGSSGAMDVVGIPLKPTAASTPVRQRQVMILP